MEPTDERERLVTGTTGRIFLTVSLGWFVVQLGRQLLPPLLPTIIEDLAISGAAAGFMLTLMWAIYAIFQYPSGRWSDELSRKTLLVIGLSLLVAGFLVVAMSGSYPVLLVGVAIVGLGAGLYPTAARALVSDLFVARRGQGFGIHTAAGDLGNATAGGLAIVAVAVATWQGAFVPVVLLLGVVALGVHVWSREAYVLEPVGFGLKATGRRLFGNRRMRWILVAYALFSFTWQSSTGFLPTLLQFEKGFSVGLASAGFALYFFVGALAKPISGFISDSVGRARVAVAGLVLAMVGLVTILLVAHTWALLLAIVVFAMGLMAFPPVMQAYLMDIFPDHSMGGDLGAMRTAYIGFGSLGPTYVGFVAGIESYTVAFLGLLGCLLVSATIVAAFELWS